MSQRPLILQPEKSPIHLFGHRLRELRKSHGLSQAGLGKQVSCSGSQIAKMETALRPGDDKLVRACDEALGAGGLLVDLWEASRGGCRYLPSLYEVDNHVLDVIRRLLDVRDLPADGPVRDIALLAMDVGTLIGCRLNSNYAQLAAQLPFLLPELQRAHLAAKGEARAGIAGLLLQTYRCADALADKAGHTDLSARLIDTVLASAAETFDPNQIGTAEYVRAEVFFANGDYQSGVRALEMAADRVSTRDIGATAVLGSLHMRASILATRAQDHARGHDHLAHAAALAQRVPEGIYYGTAFGPASVRIHEVSRALDSHDYAAAVASGRRWNPPEHIPCERRSHFHIDLGQAHLLTGQFDQAAASFDVARRIAPEHVHRHQELRQKLAAHLTQGKPARPLERLIRWMGVRPGS